MCLVWLSVLELEVQCLLMTTTDSQDGGKLHGLTAKKRNKTTNFHADWCCLLSQYRTNVLTIPNHFDFWRTVAMFRGVGHLLGVSVGAAVRTRRKISTPFTMRPCHNHGQKRAEALVGLLAFSESLLCRWSVAQRISSFHEVVDNRQFFNNKKGYILMLSTPADQTGPVYGTFRSIDVFVSRFFILATPALRLQTLARAFFAAHSRCRDSVSLENGGLAPSCAVQTYTIRV